MITIIGLGVAINIVVALVVIITLTANILELKPKDRLLGGVVRRVALLIFFKLVPQERFGLLHRHGLAEGASLLQNAKCRRTRRHWRAAARVHV